MDIQVTYSETNPNFWGQTKNFFERLIGTPVGIILLILIFIPLLLIMLLFYSLPKWLYDKIRRKKYETTQVQPEQKDWQEFYKDDNILLEREFFEGIEEIEGREDYSGEPYDWDHFVGYKIRTTPTNPELENKLFGYDMEFFENRLYVESVNYENKTSDILTINLRTTDLENIKNLDRNYRINFDKTTERLLIKGELDRKKIEIEVKRSKHQL